AASLTPSADPDVVPRWQRETREAALLLDRTGQVPLGGIRDIRSSVRAASIDGMLEPAALLSVADTLAAGRQLRAYLIKHAEAAPSLAEFATWIREFPDIEVAIHAAIDDHAEVRDDASPTLARLRKESKILHGRVMERLQTLLRSATHREMIQEP